MELEGIIDWERPKVFRLKEALERFAKRGPWHTRSSPKYLVRRLKERLEKLDER